MRIMQINQGPDANSPYFHIQEREQVFLMQKSTQESTRGVHQTQKNIWRKAKGTN